MACTIKQSPGKNQLGIREGKDRSSAYHSSFSAAYRDAQKGKRGRIAHSPSPRVGTRTMTDGALSSTPRGLRPPRSLLSRHGVVPSLSIRVSDPGVSLLSSRFNPTAPVAVAAGCGSPSSLYAASFTSRPCSHAHVHTYTQTRHRRHHRQGTARPVLVVLGATAGTGRTARIERDTDSASRRDARVR